MRCSKAHRWMLVTLHCVRVASSLSPDSGSGHTERKMHQDTHDTATQTFPDNVVVLVDTASRTAASECPQLRLHLLIAKMS